MINEGGVDEKGCGTLLNRYFKCNEDVYDLVEKVLLNVPETAEKEKAVKAIMAARALAKEIRESADEVPTVGNKAKLTSAEDVSVNVEEGEGDAASDREDLPKRSRKEGAITGQQRILAVMAVMKDAYGALPKQFWGLSHAADLLAPRGLLLDVGSLDIYNLRSTEAGRYPIVAVTTAQDFNEPIAIISGVKKVSFGRNFDCPVMLHQGIEELTFSTYSEFNQEVDLPASLRKAKFGDAFNKTVTLPPLLVELELGDSFKRPIDLQEAPKLRVLRFGDGFDDQVTLPPLLEVVEFGSNFNQIIDLMKAPKLRVVTFGECFDWPVELPNSLEQLEFGEDFNHPLILPPRLKKLILSNAFNYPIQLVDGLEVVNFGDRFNFPLTLPSSLTHLYFERNSDFEHPIELPAGLKIAIFGLNYSRTLTLPEGLESITVNENLPLTLPPGCKRYVPPDVNEYLSDDSDSDDGQ